MNRKQFGKLIASLRQDLELTQSQLAEYCGGDVAIVSQIERGVKKHLEPELLVSLANSLQLTTLERREFLLAATGVESGNIVRQPSAALATDSVSADRALTKMISLVERLRVPAYLLDVYADAIAINYIAFAFFQITPEMMASASNAPGGLNAIRLVFGKELAAKTHLLTNWDYYATSTMKAFRESSLRYRMTPYFQHLMKSFRNPAEYPLFNRYWRAVASVEQDRDGNYEQFSYDHDSFGHLEYAVSTSTGVTVHGELMLNQYIPTDDQTKSVFDRLAAENGAGVIRLATWPIKKMP